MTSLRNLYAVGTTSIDEIDHKYSKPFVVGFGLRAAVARLHRQNRPQRNFFAVKYSVHCM